MVTLTTIWIDFPPLVQQQSKRFVETQSFITDHIRKHEGRAATDTSYTMYECYAIFFTCCIQECYGSLKMLNDVCVFHILHGHVVIRTNVHIEIWRLMTAVEYMCDA